MKYILSIDQGTTSTRCIVFDKSGNIISLAQKEHDQIYPKPGWVEHNPDEIWQNTQYVINEALNNKQITKNEIGACGITNQRETTVCWNKKTGRPYYNALVWQDTRVENRVSELEKSKGSDYFRTVTGLPLATYFSGLKLAWLLNNVPEIRKDAEKGDALFGNIDTFLAWNLTGGINGGLHITDVTNASRTQLMNLQKLEWEKEILDLFGIPKSMLPQIKPSSKNFGKITLEILKDVPLAGILGDQQAALVGQVCFDPGEAKNTYGTGCFLLMNTGEKVVPSKHGLLSTVAYQIENEPVNYALEGSIAITGALIQWLRDNLGIIKESSEVETYAEKVEDNGGAYIVPAFSGLYAPYWKANARGIIAGLTRYVNKNHICRAALESTAYQVYDVLKAMEKDSNIRLNSLRVDGGMTVNNLLMQFQADIIDNEVIRPKMIETTALGAAYAAGLAIGFWKSKEDLKANWGIDRTWDSTMDQEIRRKNLNNWEKAISKSMDWE